MRCIDATANMYLALAAMFSAGLLGCVSKEPLLSPDTGIAVDPWPKKAERLPSGIDEALDRLAENCKELASFMESSIIQHYINVKRVDTMKMSEMGPEEARQLINELF